MSKPTGTANILHQFAAYNQLREDYSPEVANTLTQKNLARHNVPATLEEVEAWHRINTAAVNTKLDIPAERSKADVLANAAVGDILEAAAAPTQALETMDDDDADESSLTDIYCYENNEDNEEAALDDVLKAQEYDDWY